MSHERRYIRLGLSSVFEWSVWRFNESHTKRTLERIQKEKDRFNSKYIRVTAAFDTIITFLQSALPEERFQHLNTYSQILKKNPKHLNVFIDMIVENLTSTSIKKKHATALIKDLTDQEMNSIVGNACLELGMAYVEVHEIIDFEHMFTQIDRNMPVRQKSDASIQCLEEIDPRLKEHLHFKSKNDLELPMTDTYGKLFTLTHASKIRDRKMEAVIYLSEGLTRVSGELSKNELLIWKYFLAKAYSSLLFKSHQTGFEKHLHKKWRIKAMQLFYEVINGSDAIHDDDETLNTNKARSYTYIGKLLHQIAQREDKGYIKDICNSIHDAELKQLLEKSPLDAFEAAKSIRPNDISVLVHFGNYLVNYKQSEQRDEEEDNIDKALVMLSAVIKQDEDNGLARAIRMTARKKKYTITTQNNYQPASMNLLLEAVKDGEFCLSSFPSIRSMLDFSRILHWLADPTNGKPGSEINEDYLQKAIGVLITVDSMFQHHNSAWVYKERANCHFIKKEVEEALIYAELAFYANRGVNVSISFTQFCNYFIDAIEGKRLDSSRAFFALRRLKTAIATLQKMYQEKSLQSQLHHQDDERTKTRCSTYLEKHLNKNSKIKKFVNDVLYYLDDTIKSLKDDIMKPESSIDADIHNLPDDIYCVFVSKVLESVSAKIDSLSKDIDPETPRRLSKLDVKEMFVSPGTYIPSPSKFRQPYNQTGKRYDFFVLHSNADNDWVVCCLLQQLEYGQYGFKGCVQERDFEAGKTILENMRDSVNNSNKIFIVVSGNTTMDFYEDLESHDILKSLTVFKEDYRDTYVLNVGVEERPQQLKFFPYIKCGPLPLYLNEVRDILAIPRPTKPQERPRVFIQPIRDEQDLQKDVLSVKCMADEDRKVTATKMLEFGIPRKPIYYTAGQVMGAESILEHHFPESEVFILYEKHVVCFDAQKRLAKWVTYKLTKDDIQGPGNRDDARFQCDPRIPEEMQPSGSAFNAPNVTRGHMTPAADSKASQRAMRDTFKYTNIYPEYKKNKMWLAVEVYVREKVLKDFKEVWIYIIPAFEAKGSDPFVSISKVGGTGVAVPTHMYKFVIARSQSGDEMLVTGAFKVRNEENYGCKELERGNDAFKYIFDDEVTTDIKTIEQNTGIQIPEKMKSNGDLLEKCRFITADDFKEYEKKHIQEKKAKNRKKKKTKND